MAQPFSRLPTILSRRRDQFLKGIDILSREAALEAGIAAVEATPVDTGRARSNWIGSIGAPNDSIIFAYAPGSKLGRGERGNFVGSTAQQGNALSVWVPTSGQPAFIANNVEYISVINFGGPTHSPNNMLEKAAQRWAVSIKNFGRILI